MTIDRKLLELMHADIDGRLPEGEKAGLARQLAGNPQAAAVYEGLKQLSRELSHLPNAPAPPTLKASIMRALGQKEASSARSAERRRRMPLVASWRPAYVFAFGALAGVAFMLAAMFVFSQAVVDHGDVSGAMVRPVEPPLFARVDEVKFAAGGARGEITTERSGAFRLVSVHVSAGQGDEVVAALDFGGAGLRLSGVRPMEGQIDDVQVLDDAVRVHARGEAAFEVILLADEGSRRPATFTVSRGGHEVYRAEVALLPDGK